MSHDATTHLFVLDVSLSTTAGFPQLSSNGVQGIPANYYIVIDSITATFGMDTAGTAGLTIGDDAGGLIFFSMQKSIADSEADFMHVTFPKGLIASKLLYAPTANTLAGSRTNATYASTTGIQMTGSPTTGLLAISYRYVSPAEVGW